ncbi:helix-turn-helix domain-containing protein [Ruegeria sp. EL01]|uniref:helix-turn-helix domain-containing protein n=1 Tax=Ruegeria sp. EL01 TaxID=2107578 RepID=UPI000EA81182|nr:helix-turn-helix transcriptional regulator [Ruegeria sp. EL01]
MLADHWIKEAKKAGWKVDGTEGICLRLRCMKASCDNSITVPLENLGPVPEPCDRPHFGQFGADAFKSYKNLVDRLVTLRKRLGMNQDDLNAAMGVAEGYVNKLESFHRFPSYPMMMLWMECLGLEEDHKPCALPKASIRAIEGRKSNPYQPNQARHKYDR